MLAVDNDVEKYIRMQPGEVHIYHTGMLAMDRGKTGKGAEVADRAVAAYRAYQSGLVHLVQKRLGPYKYQYMAVRR